MIDFCSDCNDCPYCYKLLNSDGSIQHFVCELDDVDFSDPDIITPCYNERF